MSGIEFFKERKHRAAKQYGCDVCAKKIEKGDAYVYVSMKYDGEFSVARVHVECNYLYCYVNDDSDADNWCSIANWLSATDSDEIDMFLIEAKRVGICLKEAKLRWPKLEWILKNEEEQ